MVVGGCYSHAKSIECASHWVPASCISGIRCKNYGSSDDEVLLMFRPGTIDEKTRPKSLCLEKTCLELNTWGRAQGGFQVNGSHI